MSKEVNPKFVIGGPQTFTRSPTQVLVDTIDGYGIRSLSLRPEILSKPIPPDNTISILHWLPRTRITRLLPSGYAQKEASRWQRAAPRFDFIIGQDDDPTRSSSRWQDSKRLFLILQAFAHQTSSGTKELLVRTNKKGQIQAPLSRDEGHSSLERPFHLCVTGFVTHPSYPAVLVGQRSRFKKLNPELFQAFPSGHVNWPDVTNTNSPKEMLITAWSRELGEETNLKDETRQRTIPLPHYVLIETKNQREWFAIFVMQPHPTNLSFFVPNQEFRTTWWVPLDELVTSVGQHPERFRPGFPKILEHALPTLRNAWN